MATKREMIDDLLKQGVEEVEGVDITVENAHKKLTVEQLERDLGHKPVAEDSIAGPSLPGVPLELEPGDVPGETERPPEDVATHSASPMVALAKKLFGMVNSVRNNRQVMKDLPHYQQVTLFGAYLLTGQALGRHDSFGPITIGRQIHKEGLDLSILNARPVIEPGESEDVERELSLAVKKEDYNMEAAVELLSLPDELTDSIREVNRPDVRTFCAAVYDHIREVRGKAMWTRVLFDFHRKALQGCQITAAQLLGLTDSHGPITLQRFLKVSIGDPRILNAMGYYRPPRARRHRVNE
jgi:hypothetical protein